MDDIYSGCTGLLRRGVHVCADQPSDPKSYGNDEVGSLTTGRCVNPEMEKLLSDSKLHAVVKMKGRLDIPSLHNSSKVDEFCLDCQRRHSFDQRPVVVSAQNPRLQTHVNTVAFRSRIGNKVFAVKLDLYIAGSGLFSSERICARPRPPAAARPGRRARQRGGGMSAGFDRARCGFVHERDAGLKDQGGGSAA
jgi:hypothetical protein